MNASSRGAIELVVLAAISVCAARAGVILAGSAATGSPQDSFSVSGLDFSASGTGGFYSPAAPCSAFNPTTCNAPGSYSFSDIIDSEATPSGVSGAYTVNGVQYSYSCNQASTCGAGIDFTGVLTLPDLGSSPPSTWIITAPFTSVGGIGGVLIAPGRFAPDLTFQGAGIATITLHEIYPGQYSFSGATYTFVATPEPQTMCLFGLGLAVICIAARTVRADTLRPPPAER